MDERSHEMVPRIGALLVALGYVTQEQLDACLLLKAQDYANAPLGQILVRCGYIAADDLDRVLHLQQEIKSAILSSVTPFSVQCSALILTPHEDRDLAERLRHLGVTAQVVRGAEALRAAWTRQPPDCLLIEPSLLDAASGLPEQPAVPLWVLPPIPAPPGRWAENSPWAMALARFIQHVQEANATRGKLRQYEAEAKTVAAILRRISVVRAPMEALEQLIVGIKGRIGVEAATLYRFDRPAGELVFEVVSGPGGEHLHGVRFPTTQGVAGWVARNGQPLIIPNVRRDTRFAQKFDLLTGFTTRSMLCVPLLALGEVWGVLQLINKSSGDEFNERDLMTIRTLSPLAALLQALAAAEQRKYS